MKDGLPVSIAELIAAGARPQPAESVAIVIDVCQQVVSQPGRRAVLPAITPSALFVDGSGTVAVAGGAPVEDDQTVQLIGRLLLQMLPAPGTPGASRVPSRLSSLASRAASGELGGLSVARLAATMRRFAPEQPQAAIRALFERWSAGAPHAAAAEAVRPALSAPRPDRPSVSEPSTAALLAARRARRRAVGALVGALLILAGVGAAYWLSADATLPPIPLSPSILLSEPPPAPRDGWELLDPAGLAVQSAPQPVERLEESRAASEKAPGARAEQTLRALSDPAHRPE